MTSPAPDMAFQKAIYRTLAAKTELTAIVPVKRLYDVIPIKPNYPFLYISDKNITHDDELADINECSVNIHAISRAVDSEEIINIAMLVREALYVELEVDGFQCPIFKYENTRYMSEDGQESTAIISFTYTLLPNP